VAVELTGATVGGRRHGPRRGASAALPCDLPDGHVQKAEALSEGVWGGRVVGVGAEIRFK
jgi:hypothetical protein